MKGAVEGAGGTVTAGETEPGPAAGYGWGSAPPVFFSCGRKFRSHSVVVPKGGFALAVVIGARSVTDRIVRLLCDRCGGNPRERFSSGSGTPEAGSNPHGRQR